MISRNIMLDPSLLIAENSMANTITLVKKLHSDGYIFYIPKSFKTGIAESINFASAYFFRNYLQQARPSNINSLINFVNYSDLMKEFEVPQELKEKYQQFYFSLSKKLIYENEYSEDYISRVIFEEWVFLQQCSWIVSRTKMSFNKIIDAGAICLHFGKTAVEKMIKKSLKKKEQDELIKKVDVLRAFGKWIAVGGPPIISLFNSNVGIIGGITGGFFLLFDPNRA